VTPEPAEKTCPMIFRSRAIGYDGGMALSPRNRVSMWWLGMGLANAIGVIVGNQVARSLWPGSTALYWIVPISAAVAAQTAFRVIAAKFGCRDMPVWPKKS
jgi:hypothetical protein